MKIAGIELEDAGYMPDKNDVPFCASEGKEEKPQKRYPTLYVNDKEMPAIKNKERWH